MDPRPVEQWIEIFSKLPCPIEATVEGEIANRIIGDLVGYRHNSAQRLRDVRELSNALEAYAKLLHKSGVTP